MNDGQNPIAPDDYTQKIRSAIEACSHEAQLAQARLVLRRLASRMQVALEQYVYQFPKAEKELRLLFIPWMEEVWMEVTKLHRTGRVPTEFLSVNDESHARNKDRVSELLTTIRAFYPELRITEVFRKAEAELDAEYAEHQRRAADGNADQQQRLTNISQTILEASAGDMTREELMQRVSNQL